MKFNLNIPISSSRVRYRITHFSSYANFLITEKDDTFSFIPSNAPGQPVIIKLDACGSYGNRPKDLIDFLNKLVEEQGFNGIKFHLNILGTISLVVDVPPASPNFSFTLLPMSHRVQTLLGLYDVDPTTLITKTNDTQCMMDFPCAPMICFGNVLYLVSSNLSVIGVNDFSNGEYKLSIAYKYAELIIPTAPMVSKRPGYWITCRAEDLSRVEFQLVDWEFFPVKILNPIHVSIELEFINNQLD